MKPTCEDFDHLADPQATVAGEERQRWQRHLKECAGCRQQLEADRMLRTALASKPSLGFSEGFDTSLRQRLVERRRPRSASLAERSVLAGYATAATALSVWILGGIDWPSTLSPGAGAVLVLAALASPLLLLPQSPLKPPGLE